jgi:hypothetical protein
MKLKKITILTSISIILFLITLSPSLVFSSYEEARQTVQIAAQPFIDQGYYVGNKYNSGVLQSGKSEYMSVHLFQGNRYVFIAGGPDAGSNIDLLIYDENLSLVAQDNRDGNTTFIQYTPNASGIYKIKISMQRASGRGADWCFTMGYR